MNEIHTPKLYIIENKQWDNNHDINENHMNFLACVFHVML